MAEPQKDGHAKREHLQAAAKRGAKEAAAALEGPELPAAGAHVWEWFLELHAARGAGEFGISPIGYADIDAWARLTGRLPRFWEVAWLREIDRLWLAKPKETAQ